jgi:hypothetical protein
MSFVMLLLDMGVREPLEIFGKALHNTHMDSLHGYVDLCFPGIRAREAILIGKPAGEHRGGRGPGVDARSRAHGISPLGTSAEAPGPPSSGSARQEHRVQVSGAIAAVKGAKGLPVPGAVAAAPGPATQALQVTGAARRLPGHVGARDAVAPAKRNRRAKCPSHVPKRLHRRAATLRRA